MFMDELAVVGPRAPSRGALLVVAVPKTRVYPLGTSTLFPPEAKRVTVAHLRHWRPTSKQLLSSHAREVAVLRPARPEVSRRAGWGSYCRATPSRHAESWGKRAGCFWSREVWCFHAT